MSTSVTVDFRLTARDGQHEFTVALPAPVTKADILNAVTARFGPDAFDGRELATVLTTFAPCTGVLYAVARQRVTIRELVGTYRLCGDHR